MVCGAWSHCLSAGSDAGAVGLILVQFFYCMSSNSFAVVRRLVLFRVRQNQVTKNLFSNSSAGLAIISAQFRNIFFQFSISFDCSASVTVFCAQFFESID